MLKFLYAFFFGCFHAKTTFPMTVTTNSAVEGEVLRRTYVACLECGEELAYNWDKMKIEGRSRAFPRRVSAPVISIARETQSIYERLLPAGEAGTLTRAAGQ